MTQQIALVQMVSSARVDVSLARAETLILEASASSDYIFLPENFAALGSESPRDIGIAECTEDGPIRRFLRDMADRTGCWIFAGTFPVGVRPDGDTVPGGRVRAASIVYDPTGAEVCRYDKVHMFDVEVSDNLGTYLESATFEPGTDVIHLDLPFGRLGLTVCYDIRFPELYRRLFSAEVDMITVPSAFTEVTGEAHFELLMRARAVENCCFMIAACQGGEHDSGRRTWGHSMVVDPWGNVIAELGRGDGVLTAEIDLALRNELRRNMPFHQQQRLNQ